jgi:group I intron endonuclease
MKKLKRGIYVLIDRNAPKAYVGSTEDQHLRFNKHYWQLRKGVHSNWQLQRAFNADHVFEVFFIAVMDKVDILALEQELLDEFMPGNILYNIAKDAKAPNKGMKASPETLEKMRKAQTGKRHTPESIERHKIAAKLRGVSQVTRDASAAAKRGVPLSEERKEALRISSTKAMTPEARAHLSKINLGIPHTPEVRARMKEIKRANSGRPCIVEGVRYDSQSAAGEALGFSQGVVKVRINSPNPLYKNWNHETPNLTE